MIIYRAYFNSFQNAPQCWSVDEGTIDTEINVCGIFTVGCQVVSRTLSEPERAAVDSERQPVAWLEIPASRMRIEKGLAVFYPLTWS